MQLQYNLSFFLSLNKFAKLKCDIFSSNIYMFIFLLMLVFTFCCLIYHIKEKSDYTMYVCYGLLSIFYL